MGHTYTNLLTHIIFSTKDRLPYHLEERCHDVFAYMGGIVRDLKGAAINVSGTHRISQAGKNSVRRKIRLEVNLSPLKGLFSFLKR